MERNDMEVVYVPVDQITPYDKNPRRNDEAVQAVASSIREFGFRQPIVVDKDGVIIVGHTRLKAAQELGMEEVPVVYADLTEEQAKAYRLADNKTGELAGWDFDLLDLELDDIDMDMEQFGFADVIPTDALDDLFAPAPDSEKEPKKVQCPHCGEWFTP